MASGFFALLDDIAVLMDDIALMSKVASKKTAGILGDDLAVNAEKASGFDSSREIPVLLKITKGSLLNKLIILPLAFLLSAYLPIAITIILILGALYLSFEGTEKVYEFFFHRKHTSTKKQNVNFTEKEISAIENAKVKSAIVTDFILSIEIIIVALGTVLGKPIITQITVVTLISILATIGVYGIVMILVKIDDFGYKLINLNEREDSFSDSIGRILVNALPKIIKGLSVVGTIALLLVSGGIFVEHIPFIHDFIPSISGIIKDFITSLIIGSISLFIFNLLKKLIKK